MKTYAKAVTNPGPKLEYFYPQTKKWSIVPPAFEVREILKGLAAESTATLERRDVQKEKGQSSPSPLSVIIDFNNGLKVFGICSTKVYTWNPSAKRATNWPLLVK